MKRNSLEDTKNFTASFISSIPVRFPEGAPSHAELREYAKGFAALSQFSGDLEPVVEEALIAIDTRMGAGTSLVDFDAKHDEEWVYKRSDIKWTYIDAYEKFLKAEGWHPNVVRSLSDVSAKILGHLQDPASEGTWDRRGLVIGHVQSGKTANYMGVIARAADAGYKFIIVIAGIHNNLRKQTQERIDEGFIGMSSDPDNRITVGVGFDREGASPASLTTVRDDFNKRTANQVGMKLNYYTQPTVVVIKKNVHTLRALHKWLKEMNARRDGRISDVPMLMIDDEADNASINTNKEDIDPTKTNSGIRRILALFDKSCYVGYTATPFANIFINPEAYEDDVREELFPRDFIYCLDAPTTYFGPNKVFVDEEKASSILRPIEDCADYLPITHKKDYEIFELPPSLYAAIRQFILVRAIRNLRGHTRKHCSMMVNVSRFVDVQKSLRDFVSIYVKKLREAVRANYAMPDRISQKNIHLKQLEETFREEFSSGSETWPDVKAGLNDVLEGLRLYVINSKSDEALDYKKYEKDGVGLTAIAIGGLSLSRGLTIEGLCVSYMYRNTRMYDTLMQMGRWFGYRPGYEDLCRVHLSPESIDWYAYIAGASEELRLQIKRMRRDRLSPRQFGLYVRDHPDKLLITAANKMRSGKKLKVHQNFNLKLRESFLLPSDQDLNEANERLISESWKNGFGGHAVQKSEKGWQIKDVPVSVISGFLAEFRTHYGYSPEKAACMDYLDLISEEHPVGDILLISVQGKGEDSSLFRLGYQERKSSRVEGGWRTGKYRVASRGDEKVGLTDDQKHRALEFAKREGADKPSDVHFREARNKPLLMIHVLQPNDGEDVQERVPAFGVSFPGGNYTKSVNIVANPVWMESSMGAPIDIPDEEEDYDD